MISIFALPWRIGWFHHQNFSEPFLHQYQTFGVSCWIQMQFMITYLYGEVDEILRQWHHIQICFIMRQYCGGDEEFSHQILLVHNFVIIRPLSLIDEFTCSLYCNLSATKRLEGLELWGRRYCYWQRRRPWFDGHGWRWCVVLCVVRCCGGGAYPPFANVLGVEFLRIFHPKNTSFAHTKIPSKKPFCARDILHFGTYLLHPKQGVCGMWQEEYGQPGTFWTERNPWKKFHLDGIPKFSW